MKNRAIIVGVFSLLFARLLTPAAQAFVHPGGWVSTADITRIRGKVATKAQPWYNAYTTLLASGPTQTYQPSPVAVVTRNGGGSSPDGSDGKLRSDASNAYTLMIKWVATGDSGYGDAAIRVIDGWSAVLTSITGSDAKLATGIYGNKFAQAAELAAYYKPNWANQTRAQTMFRDVFYSHIRMGASANWGTAIMSCIMSFGVFLDDQPMFDQALNAYKFGFTNMADGCCGVTQYIDSSGENAESGRDQPHSQGGIAHLLETALTAWNQGINLVAYGDNTYGVISGYPTVMNRIYVGFEYVANYNLGNAVPYHAFFTYCSNTTKYPDGISAKNRGVFSPTYELACSLFTAAGLAAPYCQQVVTSAGYAPEVTNNDHPGMGTLVFRRDVGGTPPVITRATATSGR